MAGSQSEHSNLSRDKLSTNQRAAFSAQVSSLNHRPRGFVGLHYWYSGNADGSETLFPLPL